MLFGGVNYAPTGSGLPNPSGIVKQITKHIWCFAEH